MTKIKRQFEYFSFFQNFNNPGSAPKMRSNASPMVSKFGHAVGPLVHFGPISGPFSARLNFV